MSSNHEYANPGVRLGRRRWYTELCKEATMTELSIPKRPQTIPKRMKHWIVDSVKDRVRVAEVIEQHDEEPVIC